MLYVAFGSIADRQVRGTVWNAFYLLFLVVAIGLPSFKQGLAAGRRGADLFVCALVPYRNSDSQIGKGNAARRILIFSWFSVEITPLRNGKGRTRRAAANQPSFPE